MKKKFIVPLLRKVHVVGNNALMAASVSGGAKQFNQSASVAQWSDDVVNSGMLDFE